jgi:nucleotide-binding universal stress UspA family protein
MDKQLLDRIIKALLPDMADEAARKTLIEVALYGSPVLEKIIWPGPARPFTVRITLQLYDFGKEALIALLLETQKGVGQERHQELAEIISILQPAPLYPTLAPPTEKIKSDLYVFISYARPEQALAEKIEAYLKAAGVRVFRDSSEIREGANWDMTIETALNECQRMVLLLSASSMPFRKEVHREWFFFDQKAKPIYPLYVADCNLHSRLYSYNYIDVRKDLQTGLARLLADLGRDFDLPKTAATAADQVGVFADAAVEERTLPEALQALLDVIKNPQASIVLSVEQATAIAAHRPTDLTSYRLGRIAEWSLPRHKLDMHFVNLTLVLDKGEKEAERWQRQDAETLRFNDLRDVLAKAPDPVLVLLGAPGSGKSTLLRRFQFDHCIDQLRADGEQISFFIQLNNYRANDNGSFPSPETWLAEQWATLYPKLEPLPTALKDGRVLLLLDSLNEMPHKSNAEYHEKIALWRAFIQQIVAQRNRAIFSCRSRDYSANLSSPELRVPQIEVEQMSPEQVLKFITAYSPAHAEAIWRDLDGKPQFDLFRTPIYLKLLLDQVERYQRLPKGKAELFTQFVRDQLTRNITHPLLAPNGLLTVRDHTKLTQNAWKSPFALPEAGLLLPSLIRLAFTMQQKGLKTEGALVRIDYDEACKLLQNPARDADILKAGIDITVLDEDFAREEITFFHQLLQEFFAARKLAQEPNPALVQVAWHVDTVRPTLAETIAQLAEGDPLPPLAQTGWEETTLAAAPMATDPNAFIRDLMPYNLPLAARCAASAEVNLDPALKQDLQQGLIARSQDFANADLRARIAAGLALGELGDPRFERKTGPYGDYLLPPMVKVEAGTYPMGADDSEYDSEKPAHQVELKAFWMRKFPVTNAEYALFMAAGGYEDEQWWETDDAKAWLRGELGSEGSKQNLREMRERLLQMSEAQIRGIPNVTSEQRDSMIALRNWSAERFEQQLDELFPAGRTYRAPEFWNDARFNNPAQPVVGVSWFEARAYCSWLSAQTGAAYDLPTEA